MLQRVLTLPPKSAKHWGFVQDQKQNQKTVAEGKVKSEGNNFALDTHQPSHRSHWGIAWKERGAHERGIYWQTVRNHICHPQVSRNRPLENPQNSGRQVRYQGDLGRRKAS